MPRPRVRMTAMAKPGARARLRTAYLSSEMNMAGRDGSGERTGWGARTPASMLPVLSRRSGLAKIDNRPAPPSAYPVPEGFPYAMTGPTLTDYRSRPPQCEHCLSPLERGAMNASRAIGIDGHVSSGFEPVR